MVDCTVGCEVLLSASFCGDCGNGGNLAVTFTDGEGRPHICLPNNLGQIDIVKFYGILIHELTHVDQWRDLKKCNCNGERWDGPLPDVPGVGEGIECRECEELEKVAYEQQASFLYPGNGADSKKARDEFVAAGVCVSCARSCGRDPQACPALPKEPNDAEIDEKWIDDFLDHVRKQ